MEIGRRGLYMSLSFRLKIGTFCDLWVQPLPSTGVLILILSVPVRFLSILYVQFPHANPIILLSPILPDKPFPIFKSHVQFHITEYFSDDLCSFSPLSLITTFRHSSRPLKEFPVLFRSRRASPGDPFCLFPLLFLLHSQTYCGHSLGGLSDHLLWNVSRAPLEVTGLCSENPLQRPSEAHCGLSETLCRNSQKLVVGFLEIRRMTPKLFAGTYWVFRKAYRLSRMTSLFHKEACWSATQAL